MAEEIEFEVSDIRDAVQQFEELEDSMMTAAESADRMNRSNKELIDKLDDVEAEAEDAGQSADDASQSFVGWQGTLTAFSTTATAAFEGLELGIDIIGGVVDAVSSGIGAFKGWVETNRQFVRQLRVQAQQTNLSIERFQVLSESLRQLGVEQSEATDAMFTFSESVGLAAKGEERFTEAFEDLGITLEDNQGNIRDTEELFRDTVQTLGELENSQRRAALAGEILGGDVARKLQPALGQLDGTVEDVENNLVSLGEGPVDTITDLNASVSLLTTNFSNANARVFAPVAEELDRIIEETNVWIGSNEDVITSIRDLVDSGFKGFLDGVDLESGEVAQKLNSIKDVIGDIDRKKMNNLGDDIGKIAEESAEAARKIAGIDFENVNSELSSMANSLETISSSIGNIGTFFENLGDLGFQGFGSLAVSTFAEAITFGFGPETTDQLARQLNIDDVEEVRSDLQSEGLSDEQIRERVENRGFETLRQEPGQSARDVARLEEVLRQILNEVEDQNNNNQQSDTSNDSDQISAIIDNANSVDRLKRQQQLNQSLSALG